MSRPFGSTHIDTHEPSTSFGTEYSSSTLNPLATFMVAGSVAGGSLTAAFGWANAACGPSAITASAKTERNRLMDRCLRQFWGGMAVYPRGASEANLLARSSGNV